MIDSVKVDVELYDTTGSPTKIKIYIGVSLYINDEMVFEHVDHEDIGSKIIMSGLYEKYNKKDLEFIHESIWKAVTKTISKISFDDEYTFKKKENVK